MTNEQINQNNLSVARVGMVCFAHNYSDYDDNLAKCLDCGMITKKYPQHKKSLSDKLLDKAKFEGVTTARGRAFIEKYGQSAWDTSPKQEVDHADQ